MRRPIIFLTALLLVGCDATGLGGNLFGGAEAAKAKALFVRAGQLDADAFQQLETSAQKGDAAAAFYAGLLYDPGYAKGGDIERARELYEQALNSSTGAAHNLALLYLAADTEKGGKRALALLEDAGNRGRVESMMLAASLLENGWAGIPVNKPKAVDWYEMAVTTYKDPRAELQLGKAFHDGAGRSQDNEKAAVFLTSAAKEGMTEAQYRMSFLADDPALALQWLVVAAIAEPKYQAQAQKALLKLSPERQAIVKKNAETWRHAHEVTSDQLSKQGSFTQPVLARRIQT